MSDREKVGRILTMTPEVIGQIDHISFHPIKSAGAVEVQEAMLTKEGIAGDRQFMIVRAVPDENGVFHFVTQRDKRDKTDKLQGLAILSQIKPQFDGDSLYLTWAGSDAVEVPMDANAGQEIPVQIWDDVVSAVDQGDRLAEWLSDHLQLSTRLVKAAGSFHRDARKNYVPNDNTVRFQDGYPVHWFFQESVDELSQLAGETVPWQSFRPNLVAGGSPAQTEHILYAGEVAGIPFIDPKPCDRCPVTNVDQSTGEVKNGRALTHLAKYKRWRKNTGEQAVIFGENMLPQGEGKISVGDEIVLTERRDPPLIYGSKV
ncbi:MOSC domain-containing protein [Candidatus Parcubacteria bacterium]|nr:MAG: MOSC domain-containing protein [Candidatus Parcubacteria bacterium]